MAQEDESRIPGERAETITGGRIDNNPILKRGAVAIAVIAFVAFALWSMSGEKNQQKSDQPERVVIRQTTDFEPAKEKVEPARAMPEVKLPTPVVEETIKQEARCSTRRAGHLLWPTVARRIRRRIGRTRTQ